MYTDRCVYLDGFHVYRAATCPHDTVIADELGPGHEPGWTVQQITPGETNVS